MTASPAVLRFRRLQHLIVSNGLDGLLLICGGDGMNMPITSTVVDWVAGAHAVVPDETVILCQPGRVAMWLPDKGSADSMRKALSKPGLLLQLFCPTEPELADPDAFEEAKLAAFVSMMQGVHKLGVAVDNPNEGSGSMRLSGPALMALEAWPLLAAYGLDGVGRPGFFTQCFEVHALGDALLALMAGSADCHTLHQLLADNAQLLLQHWDEMTQVMRAGGPGSLGSLTERQVAEPLASYWTYGLLRPALRAIKAVTMPPRVVFGAHTNDEAAGPEAVALQPPCAGCQASSLHMVVEGGDPRCPLRAARTYFTCQASQVNNPWADPDEEAEVASRLPQADDEVADTLLLMRLYSALAEAAEAGMEHFALQEGATPQSTKARVQEVLVSSAEARGVAQPGLARHLRVALWQADSSGAVTAPAQRGSAQLKVLRVSLLDISSRVRPGQLLGGLVYADTFLEVPGFQGAPPRLLLFTQALPQLVAWAATPSEADAMARALKAFTAVALPAAGAAAGEERAPPSGAAMRAGQRAQQQQQVAQAVAREAVQQGRRLRSGGGAEEKEEEEQEGAKEEEGGQQSAEGPGLGAGNGAMAVSLSDPAAGRALTTTLQPDLGLGRLLTLGGGEDALLLTGCSALPALAGSLFCFTQGLAFITRTTRQLWLLPFKAQLEALGLQELRPARPPAAAPGPGPLAAGGEAAAAAAGLGEALVLRGKGPACLLPPACHLTSNTHLALPLDAMTQGGRRHLLSEVLPAWHQACRDASSEEGSPGLSFVKDPGAPSPFPAALHPLHQAAVLAQQPGRKAWPTSLLPDETVEQLLQQVEHAQLAALCPEDLEVEALLAGGLEAATGSAPPSCPITLVLGLPGADQLRLASGLVELMGAQQEARLDLLPRGCAPWSCDPQQLEEALAACLAAKGVRAVVLASSSLAPLRHQLRALAAATAVREARVHLAAVVVVVNSEVLWADPGRGVALPGLREQLAAGCVDAVVLQGNSSQQLKQAQLLVSACCPGAPVLRCSAPGALQRARESLLPQPQARADRLRRDALLRRWSCWPPLSSPGALAGAGEGQGPWPAPPLRVATGPLQALRLEWTGQLQLSKLRALLAAAGLEEGSGSPHLPLSECPPAAAGQTQAGPAEAPSGLAFTSTYLLLAWAALRSEPGALQQCVASRSAALHCQDLAKLSWPALCWGVPPLWAQAEGCGGELLLLGTGLQADSWAARLAGCGQEGAGPTAAKALRTAASLTAGERSALRNAHRLDPLPEGTWFNGSRYFTAFGDSSPDHPDMTRFIEEWVAEQNAEIAKENVALAAAVEASQASLLRVVSVECQVVASY